MSIKVIDHALLAEKLSILRNKDTPNSEFKAALHDASSYLIYEAIREIPNEEYELETPLARTTGTRLAEYPVIVPVLRAGLGMLGAATALLRDSDTAFVGVAKDGGSPRRDIYLSSLPEDLKKRSVLVLDPMLASGYTMGCVYEELLRHNAGRIITVCLLGAEEGVQRLLDMEYDAEVYIAAVDAQLNDVAFIVPGLGDAGDRQFGAW